ncbi:hypothetical protein ARAF_1583 [Arsenophonus endosymbiont of Aleurodicus floccissimus]|uniref:hypothetical protein n=1 Tax=Arsenophonus endosymbiont of Aleurodicus floccissimus TaxID=2152761 RepID=UPI000EC8ED72|nr:hypothetical protein [Arsenophonus endosymbiont of Aleurodicus floccissimus]SPP31915.1 hypothetical protein ARAF_1583 [Arsenophonus endosymbiont of Aleurodicus floccissimus]
MKYNIVLRPLALIRPSEEVNSEHVEMLLEEIIHCQRWITAVLIEKQTRIIMDGNRRYCAAYRLGLACLPCVMLDYTL